MSEPEAPKSARRPAFALGLVSVLFVLSGATGLAYEVIWFKRFAQVWGASSPSIAAVVACFLFGLGLGARLFGGLADRVRRPLVIYAVCELGIAVLAVAAHFEIGWLFPISAWAYSTFSDSPLLFAIVRFAVTFLVIGPPTILMGATLPVIVRQFTAAGSSLGSATSWLYFANSLGAAAGAWMAGFHLLPALGLVWTNSLVAGLNVLVAWGAWVVAGELGDVPRGSERPRPALLPRPLAAVAFLSGTAAIVLQMVWTRNLSVLVGGSTYAFSAIVCVFILGIAAGSLAHRLLVRDDTPMGPVIGVACLGVVATTLLGRMLHDPLLLLVGQLSTLRTDPGFNAFVCVGASLAIEGLPTFFMGVLFPALVQHSRSGRDRAGSAVGKLYAWNTVGSILGATTTAVVLLPWIGSFGATIAALFAYGAVGLILFPPTRDVRPVPVVLAGGTLALAVLAVLFMRPTGEELKRFNMGQFLYGPFVYDTFGRDSELLFFEEAPTSNVMVLALDGEGRDDVGVPRLVTVRVNGKVDGGNGTDVITQAGTAYIPRILRPDATDVLVIGFGTGTTAGASLLFEGTRVDCCEIERAMVDASPFFHEINHQPELSPRYTTIVEDGRSHVQSAEETYDLIISEPSNPWMAGIGNLYTVEFYRAVRKRMKPGGLLAQWIQAYQLSADEFALIVNTVQQVFEHTVLVRIDDQDVMILASPLSVVPDRATVDRAQALVDATPAAAADLERLFASSDVRSLLLAHLVLDRAGLERVVLSQGQSEVNTDANLRLEFDAPLRLFDVEVDAETTVIRTILEAWNAELLYRMIGDWGWTDVQLESLLALRHYYFTNDQRRASAELAEFALTYTDSPEFLADKLLLLPPTDPDELVAGFRRLGGLSIPELQRVAVALGQAGDSQRASFALEELARRMPSSAAIHSSLAVVYDYLGRFDEANRMAQRAFELDPRNEVTLKMLETRRRTAQERKAAEAD